MPDPPIFPAPSGTGRSPLPPRARRVLGAAVLVGSVSSLSLAAGGTAAATGTRHGTATTASHRPGGTARSRPATGAQAAPAVEAGLETWSLQVPISRAVAYATTGQAPGQSRIVVAGGLIPSSTSSAAVAAVGVPAGGVTPVGNLAVVGHDAAGAVLGNRLLVLGGGDQTTVDTVQSLPLGGTGSTTATVVGHLPQPRSDAAAVTVGRNLYVVGGYDGTKADPQVLVTTDGRTFHTLCKLPVPVRYPAVAALGGTLYVFGGETVVPGGTGVPTNDIQAIDLARHSARVVGHLPTALAGAAAVRLAGHIYIAGGDTTTTGTPVTTNGIWAFDASRDTAAAAGSLQVPVSHAAVAVAGGTAWLLGGETGGAIGGSVQMLRTNRAFGLAGHPGAGSPYYGDKLLVADRGNNRLLLLDDTSHILWEYPNPNAPSPPGANGFYFPDDAFFVRHGTAIISNQEQNETIVELAYPSGKLLWSYGHPGQVGSAPGYLSEPDDAWLLKNGQVTVADANNCRVLVINANGTVATQIGTSGVCQHNPPTSMTSPNGDTPLPNGDLLISEIGGSWVSEYTRAGHFVWSTHVAVSYPSDPEQLGPNRYLIADYSSPGAIVEFNRSGQILYRYQPATGPGALDHPSLAEVLPSGVFMVNDDYNDRMVAIDPVTGAVVWQYGVTGHPGTAPGYLNTPDGFDLLAPGGITPTHPSSG